jgi:undecaprenyl-diphosphatase
LRHNARDITALGSPFLLAAVAGLGVIWLIGHRDKHGLVFLAAVSIGGTILTFGLKALYGRERPPFTTTYILESSPSFPSGHSLLTAALLPAVAIIFLRQERVSRIHKLFVSIGILLAIIVGISRVVLGAHYPTDVMAGWAAGFGWVALCRAGLGVFENRHVEPQVPASGV